MKYRIEVVVYAFENWLDEEPADCVAEQELAHDFDSLEETKQWIDDRLRTWNFPESVRAALEAVKEEL
jgi:hypothetical protein